MGAADLAVVGGGPGGCAAAVIAARAGLDVALYTAPPGRRARAGESLPPGTVELVEEVFGAGAFREYDHRRALANRSVWGDGALESADFMFNPLGSGWHLDRPEFDRALLEFVRDYGVKLVHARVDEPRPRRASFVIDATGRNARIARANGVRRVRRDRLVAMLWCTELERDDADAATTIEAVETGWWYRAPISRRRRIEAFMTDSDLLPEPGARRGAIVTDASTGHLERIVGDGWLAVGDAAVSFDPLSSQGIATAVTMGREAGRAVVADQFDGYVATYKSLLREHLVLQASYYGLERRWPDSQFWARRAGRAGQALAA